MSFWFFSVLLTVLGILGGLIVGGRFYRQGMSLRASWRPWVFGLVVLALLVVTFLPDGGSKGARPIAAFAVLTVKTVVLAALAAVLLSQNRSQLVRWSVLAVAALGALGVEMLVVQPATRSIADQLRFQDRLWIMRSYPEGNEALHAFLLHMGKPVSLEKIESLTRRRAMGITVPSLVDAAERLGCTHVRLASSTEGELERFGRPCLVALQGETSRDDRLMLLLGKEEQGWRLVDPHGGPLQLSFEVFRDRWKGRAIFLRAPERRGGS